ncbi:MAG: ATP synthase subunit C [Synergistaceae bacterium]|nr:ATP synthase subunit C [Synergistaceae bacterium]
MYSILILGSAVLFTICAGLYLDFRSRGRGISGAKARSAVLGVMIFLFAMLCMSVIPVLAAETAEASVSSADTYRYIGASLAIGLACVGAGIAVGYVGAAACGIIGEKPELLGKTLIFLGLAEGIAVYGIVISILILMM